MEFKKRVKKDNTGVYNVDNRCIVHFNFPFYFPFNFILYQFIEVPLIV